MLRTKFITSIATAAIFSAAPAVAGPGGGHGGGAPGGNAGANAGAMGGMRGGPGSIGGNAGLSAGGGLSGNGSMTTNSVITNVRSQGAAHASFNGLVHASPNSALARGGVTSLTGLTTGLTVNNSAGVKIGAVSNIITNRSGAVVGVQVSLNGGGTVTLPATSLSMNGTTVVTSSTKFG